MTVACARCHDHKFDPIPSADYYSLYGVLQQHSRARTSCRIIGEPADRKAYEAYLRR